MCSVIDSGDYVSGIQKMNILTAIVIYAGGPGSGCNPKVGKCGRPSSSGSKPSQGDKVLLTKPVDMHYAKYGVTSIGTKKTMPVGTSAKVINVVPKVGSNPEMLTIKVKKMHSVVVPTDSVFVHKYATENIKPADVSKRYVKNKYETADGAKVTLIKDKKLPTDPEPRKVTQNEHKLKNRFKDITGALYQIGFKGPAKNFIKIFGEPSSNSKVFFARAKGDTDAMRGTTVWVHRNLDAKTAQIVEITTGQYGHTETARKFNYKNLGSASGMLNRRYGIRFSLKG